MLFTLRVFTVSGLQVYELLKAGGQPVSAPRRFMSDDEEFRQLRQQIHDGIEHVRQSIQRAKWLLSRIAQSQAPNTLAHPLKRPAEDRRKSNIA